MRTLSRREKEVFSLAIMGNEIADIADALGITRKTVVTHQTNINRKLGVRSTAALIRFAVAHGIDIGVPRAVPRSVNDQRHREGSGSPGRLPEQDGFHESMNQGVAGRRTPDSTTTS